MNNKLWFLLLFYSIIGSIIEIAHLFWVLCVFILKAYNLRYNLKFEMLLVLSVNHSARKYITLEIVKKNEWLIWEIKRIDV